MKIKFPIKLKMITDENGLNMKDLFHLNCLGNIDNICKIYRNKNYMFQDFLFNFGINSNIF